jgi:hypothetical protein
MALAPPSTQLGCGRDIDQVWDRIDRAPDTHELTCPYCQAARADLAGLAHATQAMRDDDTTNPDLEPSPGVLDRILAVARAEVRRGRRLPLDQPGTDPTHVNTVSEQAVTATIRRTGDRIREVQIRRCVLTIGPTDLTRTPTAYSTAATAPSMGGPVAFPAPAPPTDSGPASVAVSLRISVATERPVVDVSNRLRAAVIDAVMQEVGMHVVAVDIVVEDLHDA